MAGGARRALVVGVDRYDDPGLTRLRAPAHDVDALAEVLSDPEIGDFEVTRSSNPTEGELSRAVDAFFADARPDDLLLLHLSCHGVKDASGDLYFAATDTELRRLRSTAVASSFVSASLRDSRARRSLLLLDCCYSGAFDPGMTHKGGEDVDLQARFTSGQGRGRAVLTASSAMEYAFEGDALTSASPQGTSVFTSALVHGLRTGEADRDQDGRIDLDELYEYTLDRVRHSTSKQTPHLWVYGLEGRLAVARRKTPVTVPAPLPAEVQAALENPLSSVRGSVVPHLARLARGTHLGVALAARLALEELTADDSRQVEAAARAALAEVGAAPEARAREEVRAREELRAREEVRAPAEVRARTEVRAREEDRRGEDGSGQVPPERVPETRAPVGRSDEGRRAPEELPRDRSAPTGPVALRRARPERPTGGRAVLLAALAVVGAVLVVLGVQQAREGSVDGDDQLAGGGSDAATEPSPDSGPSPSPSPTPGLPPLEWAGAAPPTPQEQAVLDVIRSSFADTGSCASAPHPDDDPRDVVPAGPDNIVCRYTGGITTVFSRFGSDAAMHEFFDQRLVSRGLVVRQGERGEDWPWHTDLPDDRPGRAYGNVNPDRPVDDERSEIGMVRDGTATYAYSYEPGAEFGHLYEWWSTTFLDAS